MARPPSRKTMKFPTIPSLLFASILVAAAAPLSAQDASTPDSRSELRVLFVGHDPASPRIPFADMAPPRFFELYKERTAAFRSFLEGQFQSVRVVYGAEYQPAMSDEVDVTIFDAKPPAISARGWVEDPETGERTFRAAVHLPESFDRPALLIAENSSGIGEGIGLKLDWM